MSQNEPNQSKVPDPEVVPQARRRRFNAKYKLCILEEAEACSGPGEIGGMLPYRQQNLRMPALSCTVRELG
jgi:transposase